MSIYILFIILIMFVAYWVLIPDSKSRKLIKKIPGPPEIPIIGHALVLNVPFEELWNVFRRLCKQYYPLFRLQLGPRCLLLSILHPDDVEIVLTSSKFITKGNSYKYLKIWLKTGLLTSDGIKWHQRRKLLTPAFHFNILKNYMDFTKKTSTKFIQDLENQGTDTAQNLMSLSSKCTLRIILESAMGISLDKIDKNDADNYVKAIYDFGEIIMFRMVRPYLADWMFNPLLSIGRTRNRALKALHAFTAKVIKDRREYHERTEYKYLDNFNNDANEIQDNESYGAGGRKKKMAMLDLLLSAERDGIIDDDGIREEVDTFAFEGHDTTASAMTFILLLLAENQEAQDKARDEVKEVLDKSNGEMGMAEVQQFNYLERCIKESLRLFPPVSTITRSLIEDLKLTNQQLPAGGEMMIHLWDIHRNPIFWEEPTEKFDPDRFLPERSQGRHPFAYLPFSAGPRNCIGQKFAMMELKHLVGSILYNYRLEPIDRIADIPLLLDIVLRPARPVYTRFVRINK